ncbi:DUF2746 domain-containing protein [Mycolicibacterium brisbanense]|uniref:Gp35 n=1 Tax=Mycolicibacterium brisbanense TaxID=146020 RepID=A0A117I876_9MYCO|nr:DUF2746 domain-containing protein [Mycolicibacterium brisbanense]MCV7158054.1 DUF2746 domain-containing protein [Mycolicibacterium brisbanense]GAS92705.1 Gp35 [Mycolicibacterium brisbanense]
MGFSSVTLNSGNWLTLIAVVALGIFQVAHGFVTRPQRQAVKEIHEQREAVKEIHEQTVNTHDTNMRADIDKSIAISAATDAKVDRMLAERASDAAKMDLMLTEVREMRRDVSDHSTQIGEIRGELRHLRK